MGGDFGSYPPAQREYGGPPGCIVGGKVRSLPDCGHRRVALPGHSARLDGQ